MQWIWGFCTSTVSPILSKFIIVLGHLIRLEFEMCQLKWVSGQWTHLVLCRFHWGLQFYVASPFQFPYIATHCVLSHFAALSPALQALPSSIICSPLQNLMSFVSGKSNLQIPQTPSVNSDITSLIEPEPYSSSASATGSYSLEVRDWLPHKTVGHKAPSTPEFTFSFEFYHLVPPLWRCLVVDIRVRGMLARSLSLKTYASILYYLLFFWQPEGCYLIWNWGRK